MPYLDLPEPDWASLVGGADDESRWTLDRDRKVGLVSEMAEVYLQLSADLDQQGLLLSCTPQVLKATPKAVDWYLAAAGYALNTLQYIRQRPENFGLSRRVRTVRDNILKGSPVSAEDLDAFCRWLSTELEELYPEERRTLQNARAVAFAILGGRALGQGQNLTGDEGVLLLKRLMATAFEHREVPVFVDTGDGFIPWRNPDQLARAQRLRFGQRLVADFSGGGRHADVHVSDAGVTIAVGEVKARKDLSNIWESWMPQVADHMRTWVGDNADAARLFFGTIITEEMVQGVSSGQVLRNGLRTMYRNGTLSGAYNLSKVAASDPVASRDFHTFIEELQKLVV